MKICTIPLDIVYASPVDNLRLACEALANVESDTDLVVLPELFTTAFVPDIPTVAIVAESNKGVTMTTVREWARSLDMAIAGSFLASDGEGRYYNRGFFTAPSGEVIFYDKRHLFPLSTEDKVYTAGHTMPPLITYRGWKFRLVLCFDVRFPVWTRNRPEDMYDVLLVPANWPHSRSGQFRILLAARGVENQIYVIAANRSGEDKYGVYEYTDSGVYDNLGTSVHETRGNGFHYAVLDREALMSGRKRFPAYVATDKWSIEL